MENNLIIKNDRELPYFEYKVNIEGGLNGKPIAELSQKYISLLKSKLIENTSLSDNSSYLVYISDENKNDLLRLDSIAEIMKLKDGEGTKIRVSGRDECILSEVYGLLGDLPKHYEKKE